MGLSFSPPEIVSCLITLRFSMAPVLLPYTNYHSVSSHPNLYLACWKYVYAARHSMINCFIPAMEDAFNNIFSVSNKIKLTSQATEYQPGIVATW